MSHPCTICNHTLSRVIDERLDSGISQKKVAAEFAVSRFAISRHVNKCRAPEPVLDSQDEIRKWLQRADDQYQLATLDQDARGAISALVAGLRACETAEKQRAKEEAAKPDVAPEFAFRLEEIDNAVNKLFEDADRRTNLLAIDKSATLMIDAYQMFERMLNNPRLKRAVLAFARDWTETEEVYVS